MTTEPEHVTAAAPPLYGDAAALQCQDAEPVPQMGPERMLDAAARSRSANVWETVVVDRAGPVFEPRAGLVAPYRPDTIVDGFSWGRATVRAASLRGYDHRYRGTPRQDDFVIGMAGDTLVLAVADGVSQAAESHVGATIACRQAVQWCRDRAVDHNWDWGDLARNAAWALVAYAERALGAPTTPEAAEAMLATTLTVAVLPLGGSAPAPVPASVFHVGDSDAWLFQEGEFRNITSLGGPEETIHSSAVAGLPRIPSTTTALSVDLHPGDVLLLGSDGFGEPMGDGTGLVPDLFRRYLEEVPPMLALAHALDFSRETFDDDRTLVAVWIDPAAGIPDD
jgi:hypothetical protein